MKNTKNRFRCAHCGFVFSKPTRAKRCPECDTHGWIVNYPLFKIDNCPLCSNIIGGQTQHSPDDEFCPLCDSHIATVQESLVRSNMGWKLNVSGYELAMRIREKQKQQWEER